MKRGVIVAIIFGIIMLAAILIYIIIHLFGKSDNKKDDPNKVNQSSDINEHKDGMKQIPDDSRDIKTLAKDNKIEISSERKDLESEIPNAQKDNHILSDKDIKVEKDEVSNEELEKNIQTEINKYINPEIMNDSKIHDSKNNEEILSKHTNDENDLYA